MRIVPVKDRLIARLSPADKHGYEGQLILPENARQRVRVFDIADVGPEVKDYKVGDKVLISFYTGIYIDLIHGVKPEDLRIITEDEIIAKIVEE